MSSTNQEGPNRIHAFLELMVKQGGSDLHLVSGQPPRVRIFGEIQKIRFRDLTGDDMSRILQEVMSKKQWNELEETQSSDFSFQSGDLGRFRVNAYAQKDGLGAALRSIPSEVRPLDSLDLPPSVAAITRQPSGLTLVTGPTGSGKSTTLAAMIDYVNANRNGHIITIEDPIEFMHKAKKCVVTHREVGTHADSFSGALRSALHEDPDVILVGELRDLETMSLALTAAETGVQIFGTLHTNGAVRTIDRIVNMFPSARQELIRNMLAESLRLVVSQQLVQTAKVDGRVAVADVLVVNQAASSMIRSGKTNQLPSVIQGGARLGMQSLDVRLRALADAGTITERSAYMHAIDKTQFKQGADEAA